MASVWQDLIPDSLLLEVFTYLLSLGDIGNAAQVCKKWYRIAQDEQLWHRFARYMLKIDRPLAPGRTSWKDEVKRLSYHVPSECCETYLEHGNEVLDVTFSHDGRYFCTTSKDTTVLLFRQTDFGGFELVFRVDMQRAFNWTLCQYSVFSPDDALLLVCGVDQDPNNELRASGAVITVPACDLVFTVKMEPATLFGGWLTNRTVVGGVLHPNNTCDIMAYKVPTDPNLPLESRLDYQGVLLFRIHGRFHLMNLLIAHIPFDSTNDNRDCQETGNTISTSKKKNSANSSKRDFEDSSIRRTGNSSKGDTKNEDFSCCPFPNNSIYYSLTKLEEIDKIDGRDTRKEVMDFIASVALKQNNTRENTSPSDDNACDTSQTSQYSKRCSDVCDGKTTKKAKSKEPNEETREKTDIDPHPCSSYCIDLADEANQEENNLCKYSHTNYKQFILFVNGIHDTIEVHEVSKEMLERVDGNGNEIEAATPGNTIKRPDHMFEYENCYIIGLALSPDGRFLYLNYRDIDKTHPTMKHHSSDNPVEVRDRIFQMEIRISCIDLHQMSKVKDVVYEDHLGFSSYPAWYICLDVSNNFIGSCSEENAVYIWDKYYQRTLSTMVHNDIRTTENGVERDDQQEGWVTNGIAFCPVDEELCVTVGDDYAIKIWRSKNRMKQLGLSCKDEVAGDNIDSADIEYEDEGNEVMDSNNEAVS